MIEMQSAKSGPYFISQNYTKAIYSLSKYTKATYSLI